MLYGQNKFKGRKIHCASLLGETVRSRGKSPEYMKREAKSTITAFYHKYPVPSGGKQTHLSIFLYLLQISSFTLAINIKIDLPNFK